MVFAFLLQYIEHFLEESNDMHKRLFLSLIEDIKHKSERMRRFYELIQSGTDGGMTVSTELVAGLRETTLEVIEKLRLQVRTDYHILESMLVLAKALHCRGKVVFLIPGRFEKRGVVVIGEVGPELVAIGAGVDVFLLYDYLTKESFFVPSCGCLSLKYRIFADLQRAAQSYAKTVDELVALNVQCQRCGKPYTKPDLERVLSDQNDFAFQTTTKNCTHDSEWGIACMLCEFPMCGLCCAAQALTAKGPLCAKCQAPYDEQIRGALSVHNYQWAEESLLISLRNKHLEYHEQKQALEEKLAGGSTKTITADTQYSQNLSDPGRPSHISPQTNILPKTGGRARMCLGCSSELKYSLCSAGCCCLFCAVSNIFSSTDLQKKCLYCSQSASTFLDLDGDCLFCKRNFRYSDMAFMCLRCGYQICEFCFLRKEGQISQCSKGQIPHKLNIGAKRKFLQSKYSRVGLF